MADPNGYTALYEKRAGNTQTYGAGGIYTCNIDVQTYVEHAPDVILHTTDSLTTINNALSNPAYQYIALEYGDYVSKGTFILGMSGTSSAYKVLTYYRSGDTGDMPWNQSAGNLAKIKQLLFSGASYWIIHRITVNPNSGTVNNIYMTGASSFNIMDSILCEGGARDYEAQINVWGSGVANTVQNSVSRENQIAVGVDKDGFAVDGPNYTHFVNCEGYGCHSKVFYLVSGGAGTIVENCDFYVAESQFSDCAGNLTPTDPDSPCATQKALMSLKGSSGTSTNPVLLIHNRLWNSRKTDTHLCGGGGGSQGQAVSISNISDTPGVCPCSNYVLFKNNILTDSQLGVQTPRTGPTQHSIVGNIFYNIQPYYNLFPSFALDEFAVANTESYLNTIIGTTHWLDTGGTNLDIRGNVIIASGAKSGSTGSGQQIDYNVYYSTTHSGETNKIDKTISTRANSTSYNVDDIIRLTATPPCDGTSGDFLYIVTAGTGLTAGSPPTYPVILGATVTDGDFTLKAIRGPYKYYRKLKTVSGGEAAYIPYAKPLLTSALPEYNFVPTGAETDAIGTRSNIGIGSSVYPNDPFDVDLSGVSR